MKEFICPVCGNKQSENNTFCHICGSYLKKRNGSESLHEPLHHKNTKFDDLQLKKLTEKLGSMNDQELQSFFSDMSEDNVLTLQNNLEIQLQSLKTDFLPPFFTFQSARNPKKNDITTIKTSSKCAYPASVSMKKTRENNIFRFVKYAGIPFLGKQIKRIRNNKKTHELEISEMHKLMEEEKFRNEMLRKQIEQDLISKYQQEKEKNAEILLHVLNVIGCSKEKIDKIFLMTEQMKCADETEAERITDQIAALISEEKEKILYQKKDDYLSQIFMNDYFKLSEKSRNFLITALMIFDRFKNQSKCDFSSICILISKSVELEVKSRYFYRFLDYLEDTRGNCYSKWPESMLQQYGSPKSICMMGDFRFIMGMNNGRNHISNRAVFISFLKERRILIGDFDTDQKIVKLLAEQNAIIENIRLNYRNPAAHTECFDINTAKACIGQVLTEDQYLIRLLRCWSS